MMLGGEACRSSVSIGNGQANRKQMILPDNDMIVIQTAAIKIQFQQMLRTEFLSLCQTYFFFDVKKGNAEKKRTILGFATRMFMAYFLASDESVVTAGECALPVSNRYSVYV